MEEVSIDHLKLAIQLETSVTSIFLAAEGLHQVDVADQPYYEPLNQCYDFRKCAKPIEPFPYNSGDGNDSVCAT